MKPGPHKHFAEKHKRLRKIITWNNNILKLSIVFDEALSQDILTGMICPGTKPEHGIFTWMVKGDDLMQKNGINENVELE